MKSTIHWVSAEHAIDATVNLYDRLFTDGHPGSEGSDPLSSLNPDSREQLTAAKLEPALADVDPGQVVQFERLGYFAADLDDATVFTAPLVYATNGRTFRSERSSADSRRRPQPSIGRSPS